MCRLHKFSIFFAIFISGRSCWVFNNVNFEKIAMTSGEKKYDLANTVGADETNEARIQVILPGTKWCGAGNVASHFDNLGPFWRTDWCCREHDYCPDVIEGGETRNGLANEAFHSRLSCVCDEVFRRCLQSVNSSISNFVGYMYFNVIGTRCFELDYPATGCRRYGGWLEGKCIEYEHDYSAAKRYQWVDVPNY